ncbi:MAG: ABC-type sugar transport system, ATPase component protein, partial [Paucimonas sp.]|nr:ABC-type sugar transport system, ATPase component protein [Paucimonas sp.]
GCHATVTTVEYFGADTIVGATIGNAALLVRVPGQVALDPGSTVQLGWDRSHQYFFDAASGLRSTPETVRQPAII